MFSQDQSAKNVSFRQADAAMSLKTWWALLFIYPIARLLTVFIVNHTRISPNQITFTAIGLRLITAGCFLGGSQAGLVAGAIAYYLAYVCDCTDGTVARLTKQTSELGRYLDHVADLVGDIVILAALAHSLGILWSPMVSAMLFMHIAECYISYLAGFATSSSADGHSRIGIFNVINRYRDWWFSRNIKSFPSFPDYNAFIFVFCPLLGKPEAGFRIGFYLLIGICLYTVFSTFVSIHSGRREFP